MSTDGVITESQQSHNRVITESLMATVESPQNQHTVSQQSHCIVNGHCGVTVEVTGQHTAPPAHASRQTWLQSRVSAGSMYSLLCHSTAAQQHTSLAVSQRHCIGQLTVSRHRWARPCHGYDNVTVKSTEAPIMPLQCLARVGCLCAAAFPPKPPQLHCHCQR